MGNSPDSRRRAKELIVSMAGAVQSQLKTAVSAFIDRDETLAKKAIEKDDYVDNLYIYTESELFSLMETCDHPDRMGVIRAALSTAKSLEKIADYSENIAKQSLHIPQDPKIPLVLALDLRRSYEEVKEGLDVAVQAFVTRDTALAKKAAKKEAVLDEVYRNLLNQAIEYMSEPDANVKIAITQLFVAKNLEKIGDTLLDMAEASLQLSTGERLKLHQYIHLSRLIKDEDMDEINLQGLWGTRSGSTIFKFESDGKENFIYKDGNIRKIQEEVEKLREWNDIEAGIVPDVISNFTRKDRQVVVTNFFEGLTLQEIYIKYWWSEKKLVTQKFIELFERIWSKSLRRETVDFTVVEQLQTRLESVYDMHPRLKMLRTEPINFCGLQHDPLYDLLVRLERQTAKLRSPFSVYIHGDLNSDNILYDADNEKLQLIDVHRSCMGDYLQDISVFMVSNTRTPYLSGLQDLETGKVNDMIVAFARRLADMWGDEFFEERLAIMLGRSLITSTRFIGSYMHARQMFLRGVERLEWALQSLEGKY